MLLDKSKNEFSKSPQPFRIKWSTRIDIYGGRREAWGKGETEAGKKEFGKWGRRRRGRGVLQVNRRYTILQLHPDLFHGGGGRRSRASSSQEPVDPVCAWNHGPVFTSKPLNPTREPSGAHGRARTRHSTHVKRLREKREFLVYSKFTRQFLSFPIEFLEQKNSREEIRVPIDPLSFPLVRPSTSLFISCFISHLFSYSLSKRK